MNVLVIHGPNLNLLGSRDPKKYGTKTMEEINAMLAAVAKGKNVTLTFFQSNHEGAIIDFLQKDTSRKSVGVLINPGALVRYGFSLRQALIDLGKPVVEVHMSAIDKTGINTNTNVLDDVRAGRVVGRQEKSYTEGLAMLIGKII